MPRAPRYCTHPDCLVLVYPPGRACPQHNSRWPTDGRTQRTTTPEHHTWRQQVLINANHQCQIRYRGICTGHATEADHIRPVAEGGAEYDPMNGQAACEPCHIAKSSDEGHRARGHRTRPRETMP